MFVDWSVRRKKNQCCYSNEFAAIRVPFFVIVWVNVSTCQCCPNSEIMACLYINPCNTLGDCNSEFRFLYLLFLDLICELGLFFLIEAYIVVRMDLIIVIFLG